MKHSLLLAIALITLALSLNNAFARSLHFNSPQQDEAATYFQKGIDQQKNGQFEAAIESFQKVVELDPKFIPAYHISDWLTRN
ncbi:MAG: tetratricopeptide repeat protein [Acidobacteria bacterium]|nr:tetratricopeptide repeat protein [Acidobacteriota bacterium]MCI0665327.1 tetratricopeptide repeat protein [Acidobacteriota bacterium]